MYLSSQRFFKTPNKTLKSQEKPIKNAFHSNLKCFPSVSIMGPPHGATEIRKQ